ncbi:hypothetical protein BDC45DRAFT_25220 [Circinella umbellata]|nr:hypothetical protein BDC45DRAFT_25220 [Circinella umbellata]
MIKNQFCFFRSHETHFVLLLKSTKSTNFIYFKIDFLFEECIKEVALYTDSRTDIKRTWIKTCKGACQRRRQLGRAEKKRLKMLKIKHHQIRKRREAQHLKLQKLARENEQKKSRKRFKKEFEKMKDERKWLVRIEGEEKIYFEDLMYEYEMNSSYVRALRPLIYFRSN